MHRRWLLCVVLLVFFTSACDIAPPAQIILVVTATPQDIAAQGAAATSVATQAALPAIANVADATPVAGLATFTPTPLLTATPAIPQPTPTVRQIQIAEQIFERGRMFWLQPTRQIWVAIVTREGGGDWYVYEDFFEEGDLELDPDIIPPNDDLKQPIRGFGRLWRDNLKVRELLGWATSDEFGFVTRYEYHPALAQVDDQFVSAPGEHVLFNLYSEGLRFVESSSTWGLDI